jgi:hypothetical protein
MDAKCVFAAAVGEVNGGLWMRWQQIDIIKEALYLSLSN